MTTTLLCASCATADEVAELVRAHYGLPPAARPPCDHDEPVSVTALEDLVAQVRHDFASPATQPPPSAGGGGGDLRRATPLLPAPAAERHPLDEAIRRWADYLGVEVTAFRADRRAFIEGRIGLTSKVAPGDVLRAALPYLQRRGVLVAARHRVVLIRGGLVGSHTVPVRLPGESLVVVPGDAGPLSAQYVMHELGHVVEHANRRGAALPERFAFDPARSEGIALLFEGLAREPDWWQLLQVGDLIDDRVVGHLRHENDWSMVLAGVITDPAVTTVDAWSLPDDELATYQRQLDYWHALVAGGRWAAAVAERLRAEHGACWWRAPAPWEWMVTTGFDEEAL